MDRHRGDISCIFKIIICILCFYCATSSTIGLHNGVPANLLPIRLTYINNILSWRSAFGLAASLGVPGYAPPHLYNYIVLAFWTYPDTPKQAAFLWASPSTYFRTRSTFGSTDSQIRANIKRIYNIHGIKLMVAAFGPSQNPTSSGYNPIICATKLASYVNTYDLDGVDINWQDTAAF